MTLALCSGVRPCERVLRFAFMFTVCCSELSCTGDRRTHCAASHCGHADRTLTRTGRDGTCSGTRTRAAPLCSLAAVSVLCSAHLVSQVPCQLLSFCSALLCFVRCCLVQCHRRSARLRVPSVLARSAPLAYLNSSRERGTALHCTARVCVRFSLLFPLLCSHSSRAVRFFAEL